MLLTRLKGGGKTIVGIPLLSSHASTHITSEQLIHTLSGALLIIFSLHLCLARSKPFPQLMLEESHALFELEVSCYDILLFWKNVRIQFSSLNDSVVLFYTPA